VKLYDPPHVVCFANSEPFYTKLSQDRWLIADIGKDAVANINASIVRRATNQHENLQRLEECTSPISPGVA